MVPAGGDAGRWARRAGGRAPGHPWPPHRCCHHSSPPLLQPRLHTHCSPPACCGAPAAAAARRRGAHVPLQAPPNPRPQPPPRPPPPSPVPSTSRPPNSLRSSVSLRSGCTSRAASASSWYSITPLMSTSIEWNSLTSLLASLPCTAARRGAARRGAARRGVCICCSCCRCLPLQKGCKASWAAQLTGSGPTELKGRPAPAQPCPCPAQPSPAPPLPSPAPAPPRPAPAPAPAPAHLQVAGQDAPQQPLDVAQLHKGPQAGQRVLPDARVGRLLAQPRHLQHLRQGGGRGRAGGGVGWGG
jgi:hypothetical protein